MFKRKIENRLNEYYKDKDSRIIIIDGARQIGKSFIIRETASKYFTNYIEIDLKSDYEGEELFKDIKSTKSFYLLISSLYGDKLNTNDDTIIFLDEIQFYPHLISLLKDLKKENRFRYIASGSLLGVTLKHIFIPMGSIDEIKMYPLDFEEFLWTNKVSNEAISYLKECFDKKFKLMKQYINRYFHYLISGGLPDAIKEYVINKNVFKTRNIQS